MNENTRGQFMGVHHLTLRVTASGLEDEILIASAMSELIGNHELVEIEKTTSYYGSSIHLINAVTKKNKLAIKCLSKLGVDNLDLLISSLDDRMDENNTLHFRIGLDELIRGDVVIVSSNVKSVKGQTKLEVYPGQSPLEEAKNILNQAKEAFATK